MCGQVGPGPSLPILALFAKASSFCSAHAADFPLEVHHPLNSRSHGSPAPSHTLLCSLGQAVSLNTSQLSLRRNQGSGTRADEMSGDAMRLLCDDGYKTHHLCMDGPICSGRTRGPGGLAFSSASRKARRCPQIRRHHRASRGSTLFDTHVALRMATSGYRISVTGRLILLAHFAGAPNISSVHSRSPPSFTAKSSLATPFVSQV